MLAAVVSLTACQSEPPLVDLVVTATWAGASADEVENAVAIPVERGLARVPGVQQMLSVVEEGQAVVHVRVRAPRARLAEVESQQAVLEAMLALGDLPDEVQTPTAFVLRPRRVWLMAGADDAAIRQAQGALAQKGVGASASLSASAASEWTLLPERMRARSVSPGQVVAGVDRALSLQAYAEGATRIAEGVTLADVAETRSKGEASAYIDGASAVALSVEGDAEVPGWTRADSAATPGRETCMRVAADRSGGAPGPGRWVRDGAVLSGRVAGETTTVAGAVSWDCSLKVQRLALLGSEAGADLSVARQALASWSGAAAVVDVPAPTRSGAAITVDVDPAKAAALGLSVSDVSRQLAFWGQPRRASSAEGMVQGVSGAASDGLITLMADPATVVLHAPESAEQLSAWPLVTTDGVWVPLGSVARLRKTRPSGPVTRVEGRRATVVDLVLSDGATLTDWSVPADVRVVPLDELGPPRVWR